MAGGALEAIRNDALWLQASTIGVAACERMLEPASGRGVAIVDCPVIGTRQPAEQGKLIVLAAGPSECAAVRAGVQGDRAEDGVVRAAVRRHAG